MALLGSCEPLKSRASRETCRLRVGFQKKFQNPGLFVFFIFGHKVKALLLHVTTWYTPFLQAASNSPADRGLKLPKRQNKPFLSLSWLPSVFVTGLRHCVTQKFFMSRSVCHINYSRKHLELMKWTPWRKRIYSPSVIGGAGFSELKYLIVNKNKLKRLSQETLPLGEFLGEPWWSCSSAHYCKGAGWFCLICVLASSARLSVRR